MSRIGRAALVVGLVVTSLFGLATAFESTREAVVARVIDGDTFVLESGEHIRIRNFDTAELRSYECREERQSAVIARDVATDWLDGRRVTLYVDGEDRYGRVVADVIVHGRDGPYNFADRMTAEGYGAHWDYGYEPQPDWCPGGVVDAMRPAPENGGLIGAISGWIFGRPNEVR